MVVVSRKSAGKQTFGMGWDDGVLGCTDARLWWSWAERHLGSIFLGLNTVVGRFAGKCFSICISGCLNS